MSRITERVEQRKQGWHASVQVDGMTVAKQYHATQDEALRWVEQVKEELREVVRE